MKSTETRPKLWWLIDLPIMASMVLAGMFILPHLFPTVSPPTFQSGDGEYFYINEISSFVLSLLPFGLGAGLLVVVYCGIKNKPRWYLPILTCIVSAPLALIAMMSTSGFATSDIIGTVTTRDGKQYCATYIGWLDSSMNLGVLENGWGPIKRYKVVIYAGIHSQDRCATLVRPVGVSSGTCLTEAPNGFIVNLWPDGDSSVAYDPVTRTAYLPEFKFGMEGTKGKRITEFSPFMLLGPSDKPASTEVRYLIPDDGFTASQKSVIAAEVNNPNPIVRSMAKELLEELNTFKPKRSE